MLFHPQSAPTNLNEETNTGATEDLSTQAPPNSETTQDQKGPSSILSPLTTTLADACIHAARDSNSLLTQLWVDGGMAVFGFFDSQYLFSSTIILMMSAMLHIRGYSSQRKGNPSSSENSSSAIGGEWERDRDAVNTASDIMESMVRGGNLPASGFYQHFLEIKEALGFDTLSRGMIHDSGKNFTTDSNTLEYQSNHNCHAKQPSLQSQMQPVDQYHQMANHVDSNTAANLVDYTPLTVHDPFTIQTALHDPGMQNFLAQHDISFGFSTSSMDMDTNLYPVENNRDLFSEPMFFLG